MKIPSLLLIVLSLLLFACKTEEQIKREKLIETLAVQMNDTQKINAGNITTISDIEEQINLLTGKVESLNFNNQNQFKKNAETTEERLSLLEEKNTLALSKVNQLERQMKDQKKYIKQVLKMLKKLTNSGKKSSKKPAKKLGPYNQAMKYYTTGNYKQAKTHLVKLSLNKKISGEKRARVLHNLGMISYINKNNQLALTYYSKLFTEFPKSGYNRSGLYHMAKTFRRTNKPEETKQTVSELMARFPKSKLAIKAKKTLL